MSSKEIGVLVLNCVVAVCLFALVAHRDITLKEAMMALGGVLVPSAAPTLFERLRSVVAKLYEPRDGAMAVAVVVLGGASLLGCGLTARDAKNASNSVLDAAQLACVFASALTDEAAVVEFCKIDRALTPVIRDLIGQREGAKRVGVVWGQPYRGAR